MLARDAGELTSALVRMKEIVIEGQADSPGVYAEDEG